MKKRKSVKYQHIILLVHNNKEGLESQNDLPGRKSFFQRYSKENRDGYVKQVEDLGSK